MTREEIVRHAASMMNDPRGSTFDLLNAFFPLVMGELAVDGGMSFLRKTATFNLTTNTRTYDTRTITSLTAPDYPYRILSLRCDAWGYPDSIIPHKTDAEFQLQRQTDGEALRGKAVAWRLYPNEGTIEIQPPASATENGNSVEVLYVAPPTTIDDGDAIDEVRKEHLVAITAGLRYYAIPTAGDPEDQRLLESHDKVKGEWEQQKRMLATAARVRMFAPRQLLASQVGQRP